MHLFDNIFILATEVLIYNHFQSHKWPLNRSNYLVIQVKVNQYTNPLNSPSTPVADSTHLKRVVVPAVAIAGTEVKIQCDYDDTHGSKLYSLKWYKDGVEMYRHVPATSRQPHCTHSNNLPGVTVDVSTRSIVEWGGKSNSYNHRTLIYGQIPLMY